MASTRTLILLALISCALLMSKTTEATDAPKKAAGGPRGPAKGKGTASPAKDPVPDDDMYMDSDDLNDSPSGITILGH